MIARICLFCHNPLNDINKNCSRRESHGSFQIGSDGKLTLEVDTCKPEYSYLRLKFPWQIHFDKKLFKLTSNLIYVERWYIFYYPFVSLLLFIIFCVCIRCPEGFNSTPDSLPSPSRKKLCFLCLRIREAKTKGKHFITLLRGWLCVVRCVLSYTRTRKELFTSSKWFY